MDFGAPGRARFLLALAFKRAGQDWIGYDQAQSRSTGPGWTAFVEGSTPRELELFGFPPPGHPVWDERLLRRDRAALPRAGPRALAGWDPGHVTAPEESRQDDSVVDHSVLDAPVWHSLTGAHADLGRVHGSAARYDPEVSPFAAVEPGAGAAGLADLGELVGPGGRAVVAFLGIDPPDGWVVELDRPGVQMVGTHLEGVPDPDAVRLGPADVPEMLDLVARTQPGPFLVRTIEFGGYLGIRHEGALVAMAGVRLHPLGYREISAVCTDASHRGRGLATRLVRAVGAAVRERGEVPILHAAASNKGAIALYQALGFELRRPVDFRLLRAPGGSAT